MFQIIDMPSLTSLQMTALTTLTSTAPAYIIALQRPGAITTPDGLLTVTVAVTLHASPAMLEANSLEKRNDE